MAQTEFERLLSSLANEVKRLNRNLEATNQAYGEFFIDTELMQETDVFDSRYFLAPYQQSKTPVKFIAGKQGQLGIISLTSDGVEESKIFINKYELGLLKSIIRHKF